MKLKLSTVAINSENPQKLVDFYKQFLGEPTFSMNGFTGWVNDRVSFMVGPHSEVKGPNQEPARNMVNFDSDDVQGDFDRIKAMGATVVSEPAHPGGDDKVSLACLADPDGNYFQLVTPWDESMMPKE